MHVRIGTYPHSIALKGHFFTGYMVNIMVVNLYSMDAK